MVLVLETAAILGIIGWAASPVINRLIGKVQSYVVKKYKWHQGLQNKLEKLAHFLDEIGSMVSLVESRGFKDPNMICWLSQLKGAIDEVDDIFDNLDCDIVKSNRLVSDPAATGSIGSAVSSKGLKRLLKKLEDIRQSSRGLVQASILAVTAGYSDDQSSSNSRSITGPLLPLEPLGYDDQYKLLLTLLLPDMKNLEDISYYDHDKAAVAIIGHGGMGKTALARRAWNDPRVKKRFGLVIWASVYNKFTEAGLLGEIWRSTSAAPAWHEGMSFGRIQHELEMLVASKRYLLVLDDVCNDESATELQRRETWSNVLAPFRHGGRGSRILVTTRAFICAKTMGASSSRRITLEGLDRESFIKLLKKNAEFGSEEVNLDEVLRSSSLFSEPEEGKWKRSPLSAKEMGLKLRNTRNKQNEWPEILATDCNENVISAHASSFRQLPPHLQRCFAYLSLFPNNFRFQPEMLLKMWVAHGFITDDGKAIMEDTAKGYFNDLVFRSFLRPAVEKGKTSYYVIHDQIHTMLRSLCANYFMMIEGNYADAKIPLTVRHLSVTTGCLAQLKKQSVLKKLRTLLVFRDPSSALTAIDKDLLRELNGLRVMDLTGTDITDLPPEIANLIHLRYLAVPDTIQLLPEEFSRLFHLQTLIGSNHAQTSEVPTKLELQFKFRTNKKPSLEQLACMDSLRGSLALTGLDVVASKEDAQKAQLKNKRSVRVLKFEWDSADTISASDSDVLEGLQPHTGLQVLHIRRYRGTLSPSWLGANNCLNQLTHLYIINCRNWDVLPSFGHLPRLNYLQITEMKSVKQIDGSGLFKSLATLLLSDLENLVEWTAGATDRGSTTLTKIEILNCPRFNKPPPFPSALISLKNCPQLKICGTAIVSNPSYKLNL